MTTESLKETLKRELPALLRDDPTFRDYVLELTRGLYADRHETEDRFYEMLGEMRRERERQERQWEANQAKLERMREEQAAKWEDQNRRWDENQAQLKQLREEQAAKWEANQAELKQLREEQAAKWEANQAELKQLREEQAAKWEANQAELKKLREEQAAKWEANQAELKQLREEQAAKWEANQAELKELREEHAAKWEANQAELKELREEHAAKWEANQAELKRMHQEIMAQSERYDRGIGALGSRWGLQSEKAFRDALAAILERSFGVQVLNVNEYDDAGEVFGRPDQIELDVIVMNSSLIVCELKSSIDKAGMYSFERKARFYERRHGRRADRLMVISPMIDARARQVGERLGIEMYGDSIQVETL